VHRASLQKKGARTESGRILSPGSCPKAISASSEKLLSVYRYSRANSLPPSTFLLHPFAVPRFKCPVPIDDYVLDVLMRDLIGHDQKPARFMVYLHLYGQAARNKGRHISASVRTIADATGLSAPTTNRDDRRPRHRYSAPPRSSPLAHAMIVGRLCQTPLTRNSPNVLRTNPLLR